MLTASETAKLALVNEGEKRHPYVILATLTVAGLAVSIQQSTVLPAITKLRDDLPADRIGFGMGTIGSVIGVGGAFGFVMSGSIVDHLSWRVLFLTGVPLVLVAVFLVRRFLPESPVKAGGRIDYAGALLLAA